MTTRIKSFAIGVLSAALTVSGPAAFATNRLSSTLVLTGIIAPTATATAFSGTGGNGGAGKASFTIPVSADAPASIPELFTITYDASAGNANTLALRSTAASASHLGNGANLIPYTLTCATCSIATATAISSAVSGTTFDSITTPVAAKTLSFQLNFTGGTASKPVGEYADTIVVIFTAD